MQLPTCRLWYKFSCFVVLHDMVQGHERLVRDMGQLATQAQSTATQSPQHAFGHRSHEQVLQKVTAHSLSTGYDQTEVALNSQTQKHSHHIIV